MPYASKHYPFERKEKPEDDWFRDQFEEMIKKLDESMPSEYSDLVKEEAAPSGTIRRYGPFVYGFSYTAEAGKEPIFREFGNIHPSYRGIEPSSGREPLVDVMDEKEKYKIFVELPGVDKGNVKLDVAEDSIEVSTVDEKKFYKMVRLESTVDPDSAVRVHDYRHRGFGLLRRGVASGLALSGARGPPFRRGTAC